MGWGGAFLSGVKVFRGRFFDGGGGGDVGPFCHEVFSAIIPEGIVDGIRGIYFDAVVGQVPYIYANTKQGAVRKCICVLHLEVNYAWKQVGIDKNVVSSSWLRAVVRYACGLTCWLSPVAGHGSDVGPSMVEKQVVEEADVFRLCI